jgi:hypothetical protein
VHARTWSRRAENQKKNKEWEKAEQKKRRKNRRMRKWKCSRKRIRVKEELYNIYTQHNRREHAQHCKNIPAYNTCCAKTKLYFGF